MGPQFWAKRTMSESISRAVVALGMAVVGRSMRCVQ